MALRPLCAAMSTLMLTMTACVSASGGTGGAVQTQPVDTTTVDSSNGEVDPADAGSSASTDVVSNLDGGATQAEDSQSSSIDSSIIDSSTVDTTQPIATPDITAPPKDTDKAPLCGDGKCEGNETKDTCPIDCKGDPTKVVGCGDEVCSSNENEMVCPIDCQTGAKLAWECLTNNCKQEKQKCQQSEKCLDALNKSTICMKKCQAGGGSDQACATQCQSHVLGNSDTLSVVLCGLQNCPAKP